MRILLLVLCLLGVAAAVVYKEVDRRWGEPLLIPASGFELVVVPGDSLRSVAASLHDDGVLAYPELLVLRARWDKVDSRIRQGEYLLPPGLTPASLLLQLIQGDVRQYQVTLPEGITLEQALEVLWSDDRLSRTIQDSSDARIRTLIEPFAHPEGLFFPDSYQFTRGDSDWSIVRRAHRAMLKALQQEWENREQGIPLETPYEALILASIVEKETGVTSERPAIAGVFTRRLLKKMRLQTDPTVIYGLGAGYTGNLKRRHLTDDSNIYNTYRHHGLPPTPIALPGREAINAVLHPAQGSALYFVAKGDGSHTFSDTLAEHNSAVRKYQLQRRQDYRSSPESR